MPFGSGNRTALRSVRETDWGDIPATPALQEMRITSDSLNYNVNNVVSEEVRSDRMISDLVKVGEDGSGEIAVELSADTFDSWLECVMASTFSADLGISGTDISATALDSSINATTTDLSAAVVGQYIAVSGFTDPANNVYARVLTSSATKITLEGVTLVDEAAGATIDINGSMMRNGIELKSEVVQKHIQDATTPHFLNFVGTRFNSLSLDFAVGEIITGTFDVMSKEVLSDTSQIAGATITPSTSTDVMSGAANLSNVRIDGSASTAFFRTLSMSLNNNLRAQDAIANVQHVGLALGTLEVTGEVEMYFEDAAMLDRYINSTAFRMSFLATDSAGNGYLFSFPRIKLETGTLPNQGRDTDIILTVGYRGIRDPITNCAVQIDKF